MGKKVHMDCADDKSNACTVKISGTKEEVMSVGMRHATEDHGYPDTSETREKLSSMLKPE
jgi:hypothetical protein